MFLSRPATLTRNHPWSRRRASVLLSQSRLSLYASTLLLMAASCAYVSAQESVPGETDEIVRVRTDLLTVPFFVTDQRGRHVGGLSQSDFAVRDDGRPVRVEYFAAGTERVALLFALDSSGSARDILTHQRETALALFSRFGRGSRVAVLSFGERSLLTIPFTSDPREPLSGFKFPATPGRRTAIFDAGLAAVRTFTASESDRAERRIVILISDGLDTVSTSRAEAVIGEARAAGVSFYVIHLLAFMASDDRLVARPAAKGFRELAERTGGAYFKVGDAKSALDPRAEYDLTPIFKAIEEDLRAQYVIGYYPGEGARDGRPHRIAVNPVSTNRKLRVRQLRETYNLRH